MKKIIFMLRYKLFSVFRKKIKYVDPNDFYDGEVSDDDLIGGGTDV